MDHYEVLGVTPDADAGAVRRAYLAAARLHHPDFHASDPESDRAAHSARMKAITEAWHVLGDQSRRSEYDERLRLGDRAVPASERERSRHRPDMPAGKGWTPRSGDDGWMDDFGAWAEERDRLLPDEDVSDPDSRSPGGVLAVGLFALAVVVGFLGMVFESREMLAASVAGVVISSVLFILLPLLEMTRRRPRPEAPSPTRSRTPFSGS